MSLNPSCQFGRSMIEMLCVLSVVAVLTLVGLYGYSTAMTYYKANQTIYDVILRATNIPMTGEDYLNKEEGYEYIFTALGNKNPAGYDVHVFSEPFESSYVYRIVVSNVHSEVCKRINDMKPPIIDEIKPVALDCKTESGILDNMIFYFDGDFKDFPNDASSSGSGGVTDPCHNVTCNDCEMCESGFCVANELKNNSTCGENKYCYFGDCLDCDAPLETCVGSDEIALNGCQTKKHVDCTGDTYCDENTGECKDSKNRIETLCTKVGGTIVSATSGTFCRSSGTMTAPDVNNWCIANGMTFPTMYELCPAWDGNSGLGKCPELRGSGSGNVWTASVSTTNYAFNVSLANGNIGNDFIYNKMYGICR